MSECLDYWEATLGPLGVIIRNLPEYVQRNINADLQALGAFKESQGGMAASIYARVLTGERVQAPIEEPPPKLRLVSKNEPQTAA